MSQAIIDKALELGKKIADSDEFNEVQEKEKLMLQDPAADQLLRQFQQLQMKHQQKQMQGKQLSQDDIQEFETFETKMLENPKIKDFYEAQSKFQDLLNNVNQTINKAMMEKRNHINGDGCTTSG